MKQITVQGLALQFDAVGDKSPAEQAREVVALVNEALAHSGLNSEPRLIGGDDIGNSEVEVEDTDDEDA